MRFRNCSYAVKNNKKHGPKEVLLVDSCSASVEPGEVLAIMGPSGAGKTTLLNMLTLTPGNGKPYGSITLNGNPFSRKVYKEHAAMVEQYDSLWAALTAREHVTFASRLYQSKRDAGVSADLMLKEMGLAACQHVRAGNQFFKGLSGGQRRRLSLGVTLSKEPQIGRAHV